MSTEHPPDTGPTPENMVSYSEQLLSLSIARLTALLATHDDITPAAAREFGDEFRALRKALEIAYHERANLQKLKGLEAGAASAGLDTDAARNEIRRRLARLRAAGGGDAFPAGAE
jgi:hypothetical protein